MKKQPANCLRALVRNEDVFLPSATETEWNQRLLSYEKTNSDTTTVQKEALSNFFLLALSLSLSLS
jgi:hypothetical protein